jgi:hypothetical protein
MVPDGAFDFTSMLTVSCAAALTESNVNERKMVRSLFII